MSQFAQAILEINCSSTRKKALDFLETELGGEFDADSFKMSANGNGFTLVTRAAFAYRWMNYGPNEEVHFDIDACIVE